MKRILTIVLALSVAVCAMSQKKVLYINKYKASISKNSIDPLKVMLDADTNFKVDTMMMTAVTATATLSKDLAAYDAIILQEVFGSGDAILKVGGNLEIIKYTKPTLINKTYAFKATVFSSAGAGNDVPAQTMAIKVDKTNQSNDFFKGVTFTNDSVVIFKNVASDNGDSTGIKTFNYNFGVVMTPANTPLAVPSTLKATTATCDLFINDIPIGTEFGATTLKSKARIVTIGFNYGAMTLNKGLNMTDAGKLILKNIMYSLADVKVVGVKKAKAAKVQVCPNPVVDELKVKGASKVEVMDATGKVVKSAKGEKVSVKALKSGIYIVRAKVGSEVVVEKVAKK